MALPELQLLQHLGRWATTVVSHTGKPQRPIDASALLKLELLSPHRNRVGIGANPNLLQAVAPGVIWVAALLAALLSIENVFRSDFEDGSLEQMALAPQPLALAAMAEVLAHWLLSGVTLALISPVFAAMLNLPYSAIPTTMFSLLLGTLCLSLTGAIGAALTVGLRRAGVLLSLLTIPLTVPTLIFGSAAVREAALGYDPSSWLALLGALAAVGLVLTPFAVAAGLRISLEA